jgi:ElaB/YqjD/DUF883 family membrane-anchored ribosome-binding protein
MDKENENLSELQQEAEASRADLMHTVDSLQSRVSPRALKEDVKEYVRDTSNSLLYDVERRIRDNPLQAAAIAAGLAFPLWRLLSSVPAPIALIGAGIALSQRGASSVRGVGSAKGSNGSGVSDAISHAADNLSHQMTSAADMAKQKINTLKTQTADAVDDAVHRAQDFASDSAAKVSDAVSQAYDSGKDIAEKATHDVELALDRTKDRLIQAIEQHPLVVGGIGLLLGAFVASCIPTTSAEASAFGEVSDGLKNRALNAVSEGMDVVKSAAGDVYDSAVDQTTKRGLTATVLDNVVHEAGDKVQSAGHEAIDRMGRKTPSAKQNGERQ